MFKKILVLKIVFLLILTILANETDVSVSTETVPTLELTTLDNESKPVTEEFESEEQAILLDDKTSSILQIKEHLMSNSGLKNSTDKKLAEKQINEKHSMTRVLLHQTIDAIYNCTPESILSVLTLHSDYDNYLVCNQVLDINLDNKLIASLRKSREQTQPMLTTPITVYDASVHEVFFRGNQMYYTSGRVDSGYCKGEKITVLNVSLVKKGSCNSRSGVTLIVSEYAMLKLTGRCESICFGDVMINITPGLRN